MGDYIKEGFKNFYNNIKNKDTVYKEIPNMLTMSRALGTIPINILYFTGNLVSAITLTCLLFITDFFDGKIARHYHVESNFGADLDAFCDKIMLLGLTFPTFFLKPIILVNFFLESIISYINIKRRKNGFKANSSIIGKIKMWPLSITIGLGYLSNVLVIDKLFSMMFLLTLGMQTITIYDYYKKYKEETIEIKEKDIKDSSIDIKHNDREELIRTLELEKTKLLQENNNKTKKLVHKKTDIN